MTHSAIALYTAHSVEALVAAGGSAAWVLNRRNAIKNEYVVICNGGHAKGDVPHRAAVLVARISDIVEAPAEREGQTRWKIVFGKYARVNIPDAWDRTWQNPVRYTSLEALGVDPASLTFEEANEPGPLASIETFRGGDAPSPLSIEAAKIGLAATFGVKPEAIEITIRG